MPCAPRGEGECAGVREDVCAAAHEQAGGLRKPQVEADLETEVKVMERGGEGGGESVPGFGGATGVRVSVVNVVYCHLIGRICI